MGSHVYDRALIYDGNRISIHDGRQSVGNDDRCSSSR